MRKSEHKTQMAETLSVTQRTVERDFAILHKAGKLDMKGKLMQAFGLCLKTSNFKQFVLDNDRQFIFQAHTKRGRHG